MEAVGTRPADFAFSGGVGVLWALAVLGLASIGIFVLPVALAATLLAARAVGRAGVLGLPVGALVAATALLAPFLT